MNQTQQRHDEGTFLPCACGREPRHFHVTGRHPSEVMPREGFGIRHMLECAPCGKRTKRHATERQAVQEWGQKFVASEGVTHLKRSAVK